MLLEYRAGQIHLWYSHQGSLKVQPAIWRELLLSSVYMYVCVWWGQRTDETNHSRVIARKEVRLLLCLLVHKTGATIFTSVMFTSQSGSLYPSGQQTILQRSKRPALHSQIYQ